MALSGSFYTNVGAYWRLQGEWSATQNHAANTSTITLKVYWMSINGAGAVYSSSSKSGSSFIEGGGTQTFTATAGLSTGQKKLLDTHVRTVTHNADGTLPDLDLSIAFNPDVSLSGTNYGNITAAADFAVNTIPRESTLSEDPTWRVSEVLPLSVNRASSSFSHVASIYVMGRDGTYGSAIKTVEFDVSQNVGFSESEYNALYNKLDGRSSMTSRVIVKTYNGSTYIGETARDGFAMAPLPSEVTSGYDAYQYITEEIDFGITRNSSNFLHTVRIKLGSYTKTFTNVGTSIAWTPTQAERDALAAQMPTETEKWGTIEIDTFYNGIQIRTTTTTSLKLFLYGMNPVWSGSVSYFDSHPTVTGITGNNQYIVSGQSTVVVNLPSSAGATAQGGATMEKYVFKLAGKTYERDYVANSTYTIAFGTIYASTNQTLTVEAIDSRGNSSTISKIVTVIPYSRPTIVPVASRINGFEATTTLDAGGRFSPLSINGTPKNEITMVRYRYKAKTASSYGSYSTMSVGTSGGTYNTGDVTLSFDSTKAYDVQFEVIDRFGSTTVTRTVAVGRPILFIDDNLSSLGFNDFPKRANEFLLRGDVTGVKGMFFGLVSSSYGNGIHFMRSSTTIDNPTPSAYDKLYMYNGGLYLNSKLVIDDTGKTFPTTHKAPNGYNDVSMRADTSHDDMMLIQHFRGQVPIANGQSYIDITFPTAFSSTPEWVIVGAVETNSAHAAFAAYNITSTGCRVYGTRLPSTTSNNYSAVFNVVAGGRKT
jgi:hypothetical protein